MAHNKIQFNIGATGEQIAALFLEHKGFVVISRNYRKKWGEIDLIVLKDTNVHFVEVKAVSYETMIEFEKFHTTRQPQARVDTNKIKKLNRVIDSWMHEESYDGTYQLDVVAVHMVPCEKYALVEYFPSEY